MSAPEFAILVFGSVDNLSRQAVVAALPDTAALEKTVVHPMPDNPYGWTSQGEPLVLLAIGADGGAELARWVAEHGLDGVTGVGLVGVTAPWAERSRERDSLDASGRVWAVGRLPLGPLEPLRAVAKTVRDGKPCRSCRGKGKGGGCKSCQYDGHFYPWRFVVACAPDDGVCSSPGCGGRGWHYGPGFSRPKCERCSGSGKALSSADVALELSGERRLYEGIDDFEATTGGHATIHYPTRAALIEHGLRAVVERLTR